MTFSHDHYGRYLLTGPSGEQEAHTRATTIAKALDDLAGLNRWVCRMTLTGLALRHDLYALALSADKTDRGALDRLADQAQEAARATAGANLGSALHALTAQLDRGEDVAVPPPFDADLDAYRKALAGAGVQIVPEMIERVVGVDDLPEPIAGTFDRLVSFDGRTFVADLKTAQSLDYAWGAVAVQLALYAHATRLYVDESTFGPMPAVDQQRAIVIHLPAGKAVCTLYSVDIAAGYRAAGLACDVRAWRRRRDLADHLELRREQLADQRAVEAHRQRVRDLPEPVRRRLIRLVAEAEARGEIVRPSARPTVEVLERHRTLTDKAIGLEKLRTGAMA
jgi:hypothetical protein